MYLEENLYNTIKDRVITHKNRFVRIFSSRYHEMIPSLITYLNNNTGIDFFKVEVLLTQGYDVVVGKAKNGVIQILGYTKSNDSLENPSLFVTEKLLDKNDIIFTIPNDLIPKKMKEISFLDNCNTGDFTVIKNKVLNLVSDREIIEHYTCELAEIVLSRYSLAMQSKIITFFIGDENNEDVNQLVCDLYNGSPFVKANKLFDPEEQIIHMKNDGISNNFVELKREYQNKLSELNNMLGINSLAVDKESGVSDTEAMSNRPYTASVANIKLSARENAIKKLNKRFGLNIEVVYNDNVASEFEKFYIKEGDDNSEKQHNNL